MSVIERRREVRIPGSSAEFTVFFPNEKCNCKIINISNYGIALDLSSIPSNYVDSIKLNDVINGELNINNNKLNISLYVRVKKNYFTGLEFTDTSAEFRSEMRKVLSPAYIGASIYKLAKEILVPEVETAYRGDGFECIVFSTNSKTAQEIQIFYDDFVVKLSNDDCNFVPTPFIKGSTKIIGFDMYSEFTDFNLENSGKELGGYLQNLLEVCKNWPDCPKYLQSIIQKKLDDC